MNLKREFILFLKENGAYSSYVLNFKRNFKSKLTLNQFISSVPQTSLITSAFEFGKTKEGNRYWTIIGNKWFSRCLRDCCI